MRLKPEEISKLAQHLGNQMMARNDITYKVAKPKIFEVIEATLNHHFEEERQIEEESNRLYEQQASTMGQIERGKAISMIRKQLAAKKEFILSGSPQGRFSEEKLYHLGHLVGDRLFDDDLCDFPDEDEGPQFFKKLIIEYFGREDALQDSVRKKIQGMSNPPFEGSREWDVLFRRLFEEERKRMGHV